MSIIKDFYDVYKVRGIKKAVNKTIRKLLRRATGCEKEEEAINTLYYFLNKYVDITKVEKAEGSLLELQECDIELLKLFDCVCKNNGINYWIDYGTLLGAVRHKGFIPWDDDVDVAMTREDYEKAKTILEKELGYYGIDCREEANEPNRRLGIGYNHKQTGIWIDVFPVDSIYTNGQLNEVQTSLSKCIYKYRRYYEKRIHKSSREELRIAKEKMIKLQSGDCVVLYHGPEFAYMDKLIIHNADEVFPIKNIEFDGVVLNGPNNCDSYLKRIYGNNYMEFPHSGVEHHGGQLRLADWAKVNNVDMIKVRQLIKSFYDDYKKRNNL